MLPFGGSCGSMGVACFIMIVSFACFFNSMHGELVFDDTVAIVGNKDVTSDGPTNFTAILTHDFWGEDIGSSSSHKSFRPVTVLTFRLNFLLHGE
jgi:hypothetical protein